MSAAGRGAVRVEHDFYATPKWCVSLISDRVDWTRVKALCEPCVGDGAVPKSVGSDLVGWALNWETFEIREGRDYLMSSPRQCELTLTNPPYNIAADFLAKSLSHSACVVYLLRINFLGSAKRKEFLSANRPSHIYTLTERPSFVDVCAGFEKPIKKKGCGLSFHKDAKMKVCDGCGGRVKAGTDATEYAWIVWDRGQIMRDEPGIYFL